MNKRRLLPYGVIFASSAALALTGCDSKLADDSFAKVDTSIILSDGLTKGEWLTYGGTYDEQRFSPLTGITPANVGKLGIAWSYEFPTSHGVEATPIMVDDTLYVTAAWSVVAALDTCLHVRPQEEGLCT